MEQKAIRVGLIGLGMIGKVHARAYNALNSMKNAVQPGIELVLLSPPDHPVDVTTLAETGSPKIVHSLTNFFAEALDLVDICTPNDSHAYYATLACRNGFNIYCEKPLARCLEEARQMVKLVQESKTLSQIAFIYRYLPAIQQVINAVKKGEIGKPHHFRMAMLHGGYLDPERPCSWRLRKDQAGGGVLADLGIHMIDLLRAIFGEVAWVQCESRTFIPERPAAKGNPEKRKVDVDDWAICMLGTTSDACGTLEVSRVAGGWHQYSVLEVFGEKGSLAVDFTQPNHARIFLPDAREWKVINERLEKDRLPMASKLFQESRSFMDSMFAAHLASIEDILRSLQQKKPTTIDFTNGMRDQAILEAAYQSSISEGVRIFIGFGSGKVDKKGVTV